VAVEGGGPTAAGVEGEIPLVARENARKLEVGESPDRELTRLAIEDDFAGRLYEAPLSGPDAVYVHRDGAFTTEVRDGEDEVGAFRVNPDPDAEGSVRIETPSTGKATLATYLADLTSETAAAVREVAGDGETEGDGSTPVRGLARALEAVAEAARRAATRAEAGERGRADQSLETVVERLGRVGERLAEAGGDLPPGLATAAERRLGQADRRAAQALDAGRL
jgi:hypothetical protein